MSQPRIIAGKVKGQRLKSIPGDSTRPITDKVKGALFNILGSDIAGCRFLDLFGGTGSVGIESLSRGAESAVFIEINRTAATVIKENLRITGFEKQSKVFQMDALKFIQKSPEEAFDVIYIAPPQYKKIWLDAMKRLDANINWLDEDGLVIVQIDVLEYENLSCDNLYESEQRRYGDTLLVFYERKLSDETGELINDTR